MKTTKILAMLALVIALAASAHAGTITWNCSTTASAQGLSGQSAGNTLTPTCTTADAAAPGGSTFLSVTMNGVLDFTYNQFQDTTNLSTTTWAATGPGNLAFSGILVTLPGGSNPRPRNVSVSGNAATVTLFSTYGNGPVPTADWGALSNIKYVGNIAAVTGATADFNFVLTYNPPSTGTPEPATMAMLGSALIGLGLIGRKRIAR